MGKDFNEYAFLKEIKRRTILNDNYSIVGTELRNRRISTSKTIEAVSSDVCSPSYLCKVERGAIVPNRYLLTELFNKLEIKQERLNTLIKMDKKLDLCLLGFLNDEYKVVKNIYDECKEFLNYRSQIIELIYFLFTNDLLKAEKLILVLDELIATMKTKDFTYYVIFKAILYFKQGFYNDSYFYLTKAKALAPNGNCSRIISLYIFYSSFKSNSKQIYFDYNNAINSFIYYGNYKIIDQINYYYSLNLISNNMEENAKVIIEGIIDKKMKSSAIFYYSLTFDNDFSPSMNEYENVRDLFKLYIIYKLKKDEVIKYIEEFKDCKDIEYNCTIFLYLIIDSPYDKYKFIEDMLINGSIERTDGYFKEYIMKELAILSMELGKYKMLSKAFITLK